METMIEITKYCSGCGRDLLVTEFSKNQSKKDGSQTQCKECKALYAREYRKTAPGQEHESRYQQDYRENNRDKCNQQKREYYATINGCLRQGFSSMNQRCNNPNRRGYKWYGGRGIENKFRSADEFIDYVTNELRVDPRGKQIHRINNDGNYAKGNIEFLTPKEHAEIHHP